MVKLFLNEKKFCKLDRSTKSIMANIEGTHLFAQDWGLNINSLSEFKSCDSPSAGQDNCHSSADLCSPPDDLFHKVIRQFFSLWGSATLLYISHFAWTDEE